MRARAKKVWDSPEGEAILRAYMAGTIDVTESARRAGTSPQGVYSAVSRSRRLNPVPVSSAILRKLEELAQLALPDTIARLRGQILALEAEVETLREENKRLKAQRR